MSGSCHPDCSSGLHLQTVPSHPSAARHRHGELSPLLSHAPPPPQLLPQHHREQQQALEGLLAETERLRERLAPSPDAEESATQAPPPSAGYALCSRTFWGSQPGVMCRSCESCQGMCGGGGLGYGRFVVFPHSKVADYFFGKIQNSIFFFKNLIIKVPLKQ